MHIFFSAIGGTAIGPLAHIAQQAGYAVSGSDKQDSQYIRYLQDHGITDIQIGQSYEQIEAVHKERPIDWFVYSSAVAIENPDAPELQFCRDHGIRMSKRDELLNHIITEKGMKLIAVAGTHGKTTTTAMAIWVFKQLGIPVSYSVGAKISFGEMGTYDPDSEYFVYEADEFDRNFLSFNPRLSIISGIDYDHPDIYPTRDDYNQAFRDFISQCKTAVIWQDDAEKLNVKGSRQVLAIHKQDYPFFELVGQVNRENAAIVAQALMLELGKEDIMELAGLLKQFPGLSRRFEKLAPNIYSDYAHTPEKIRGALQTAHEIADSRVIVVYEGLHNTRQHFIKDELEQLFDGVSKLYVVPSYRAREDEDLEDLTPDKLITIIKSPLDKVAATLDEKLQAAIAEHAQKGDLVLCLSAGGGGSLDEWLRARFSQKT